jgi:hypothetical protein
MGSPDERLENSVSGPLRRSFCTAAGTREKEGLLPEDHDPTQSLL